MFEPFSATAEDARHYESPSNCAQSCLSRSCSRVSKRPLWQPVPPPQRPARSDRRQAFPCWPFPCGAATAFPLKLAEIALHRSAAAAERPREVCDCHRQRPFFPASAIGFLGNRPGAASRPVAEIGIVLQVRGQLGHERTRLFQRSATLRWRSRRTVAGPQRAHAPGFVNMADSGYDRRAALDNPPFQARVSRDQLFIDAGWFVGHKLSPFDRRESVKSRRTKTLQDCPCIKLEKLRYFDCSVLVYLSSLM